MLRKVSPGDTILADDFNAVARAAQPWLANSGMTQPERDGNTLLDTYVQFELSPRGGEGQTQVIQAERPWTFIPPLSAGLSGEWTNCSMQVGMTTLQNADVKDRMQSEDGTYYCQWNVDKQEASLKHVPVSASVPESDLDKGQLNFYVGTVEGGVQTGKVFLVPVVYLWL